MDLRPNMNKKQTNQLNVIVDALSRSSDEQAARGELLLSGTLAAALQTIRFLCTRLGVGKPKKTK